MEQKIEPKKTTVFKAMVSEQQVQNVADKKKTSLYGTVFNRPKAEDVSISSIELFYEPYWIVKGNYYSEYFRRTVYEFVTSPEVKEVIIGSGKFPVRTEKGKWGKIRASMKAGDNANKVEIPVEEHVELDIEDEIVFNSTGSEIKFDYKIDSRNVENFPEEILKNNEMYLRPSSLTEEQAVDGLIKLLQEGNMDEGIRKIKEKITIDRLEQIYVPVYEVRCVDSKNKVETLRIDGMNLKVL
ncbi:MAG: hypothetical protein OER78_01705 [Nitrosopumilus sp.]|nr:hypothetical protein [Nitrosopumilus sp.]MDH3854917.1 hypothetical protein [Nitrosopumilus sp.]